MEGMGNKCKILTLLAIYFIAISCKQNNNQKMQEANTTFGWSALDTGKIEKDYKFKTNSFSDAALLTRIEKQLKAYAAGTGERLKLVSPPIHHENDYVTSPENSAVARLDYEERIRAGQAKLDKIADDLNRDLKTLRNKYLHWNATYGEGFKKTASQANQPNFVGGKRKREIRG